MSPAATGTQVGGGGDRNWEINVIVQYHCWDKDGQSEGKMAAIVMIVLSNPVSFTYWPRSSEVIRDAQISSSSSSSGEHEHLHLLFWRSSTVHQPGWSASQEPSLSSSMKSWRNAREKQSHTVQKHGWQRHCNNLCVMKCKEHGQSS